MKKRSVKILNIHNFTQKFLKCENIRKATKMTYRDSNEVFFFYEWFTQLYKKTTYTNGTEKKIIK